MRCNRIFGVFFFMCFPSRYGVAPFFCLWINKFNLTMNIGMNVRCRKRRTINDWARLGMIIVWDKQTDTLLINWVHFFHSDAVYFSLIGFLFNEKIVKRNSFVGSLHLLPNPNRQRFNFSFRECLLIHCLGIAQSMIFKSN